MKGGLGLLGLVLALLVVALLAKKQFAPTPQTAQTAQIPSASIPKQQVQQFQKALDDALKTPRPEPQDQDSN